MRQISSPWQGERCWKVWKQFRPKLTSASNTFSLFSLFLFSLLILFSHAFDTFPPAVLFFCFLSFLLFPTLYSRAPFTLFTESRSKGGCAVRYGRFRFYYVYYFHCAHSNFSLPGALKCSRCNAENDAHPASLREIDLFAHCAQRLETVISSVYHERRITETTRAIRLSPSRAARFNDRIKCDN